MTLEKFLQKLDSNPESIEFIETMAVIETEYNFTETAFENGQQSNAVGENSGSCKLFSFAKLNGFSEAQTLACFGGYYRNDVLAHPDANDHQNIRQFMISGWSGIQFSAEALTTK